MNNKVKYDEITAISEYKQVMIDGLKHSLPGLTVSQLSEAIDYIIADTIYNGKVVLDNNYEKTKLSGDVLSILKYIQKLEPIMTSSGVLFKKHKDSKNPLNQMIQSFLIKRKAYKKEMFKHPKGHYLFSRYNLFQLLEKLNANATYGVIGSPVSLFYNIYVAEAITRQGRSYIACSITLFESLLANNIKFNSLNEVITFINNVEHEVGDRILSDSSILDRNITVEECFYKLMTTVDGLIWIPTEKEIVLVFEYLRRLSQEDINRIYYKNNLYSFCELPVVRECIISCLCNLQSPFMNPNNPNNEIKEDLNILLSLIKEYVYYPHFYIDKLDRIEYMQRDIVGICDTDSTIISFDAWYRFVSNMVRDVSMPIKHVKYDMVELLKKDEFGDFVKPKILCEVIDKEYDYDIYADEIIELDKYAYPAKVCPPESIMYSIINIMAYICSDLVTDYLAKYCRYCGSEREGVNCKMVMKNEFFFTKALLTPNRRNYASFQSLQEGNPIPKSEGLNIAGLSIDKSTLQDDIKNDFKKIIYEDIMNSDIDQISIMKKLMIIEHKIYNSIMNKETKYFKPDSIGSMNSYKEPMRISGIVSSMIYNHMRDDSMPYINLEERNDILRIQINITPNNISLIKDDYPVEYEKLQELLNHPVMKNKLNFIALPLDTEVPDWILPFIDIAGIINSSLSNFPLESIGLNRLGNDSVNYSNIISL